MTRTTASEGQWRDAAAAHSVARAVPLVRKPSAWKPEPGQWGPTIWLSLLLLLELAIVVWIKRH